MSAPTGTPPARLVLGPRVRAELETLRTRARVSLAVRGLASAVVLLVLLALLSFGLDRLLRLGWSSRATILVVVLTMLGAVAWSRLLRPLLTPLPDDELARVIEGKNPGLEWRLLSAVQFSDPAWAPGPETSRDLAALVIQDAEVRMTGVETVECVPLGPVAQAGLRGTVVVAAAALLMNAFPQAASTWFQRDVLLSSTARWPQDTTLGVARQVGTELVDLSPDEELVVPHGSDVAIVVTATGVVPTRIYLESEGVSSDETTPGAATEADARARDERLVLDALGEARFRAVLDEVTAGFTFTVSGGDAELGPFKVRVIRRPWVEALTFKVTPPPHTKLPERTFGIEAGSVSLPVGTQVHLEAKVNKPLATVRLEEHPGGTGADVATVHTAVTTPTGFAADLVLERSAVFKVEVRDQDGLEFAQPVRFSLLAEPDEAPEVQLAMTGVGLNVTPEATLRVRIAAKDDHEVATARLRLKLGGGTAPDKEQETPLPDLAGRAEGETQTALELAALELQPKMSLTLWAEATDADPRGPNTGSSPAVQLRIVTPEQLLAELLRRLHEQRLELERMILEEERLAQGLSGQDKATLERAPRAHRDVGRAVTRAADVVEGVIEEMKSNKILDATTWDRLRDDVAKPLRDVLQGPLAQARDLAEKAGQAPEAELPQASLAAGTAAGDVSQALKAIVARMGRIEELAELVATLKKLIEQQREVLDRTRREHR